SPDGSRVGLGGTDGTVVILESETGKEIARGNAGRWVGKIKFLSEDTIVTFAAPKWLVMLKIEGNQLVQSRVLATGGDIGSIAFDPKNPPILFAMIGPKLQALETGLKRPAPVVPQSLKSDVAVTAKAPANAKATDAVVASLTEKTALQAETVLSRRTLEGLDGNEELKKRGKAWLTTGPDPDTGKKTEIRITSPYDQSFLLTPLGVIKLDHPGGTQNKVGFGRILSDGAIVNWDLAAHPRLEFVLYADEGMTVMLDRLVFEGDRGNGSFALLTEQRTEAREWETEPSMQVLLTERANVTLAVESPMAGAVLELTGGGFLGKKVLKKGFSTPTLTMDGTKPSGVYEVQLLDRPNGAILQRVGVVWDKEGKKLSASEPLQAFVPKARVSARGAMSSADPLDSTRGFQAVFGALSEEVAQVMAVNRAIETQQKMSQAGGAAVIKSGILDGAQTDAIVNTQRGNLMALAGQADERFQFSLDPDKLWAKFLEVLQGWREENKVQTMERMRIPEREFYYIRGAEFDYYRKFIDGYNEAVGRMLEAGMNAILTARAGGDAAPHLKQLDGIPAEYGVVMDRFSLLRIKPPDRWVILEAAEAILENSAAELVVQQRASEARVQGEEKQFNDPGPAFAGSGEASSPTQVISAAREAFLERMRTAQGALDLYAADGVTVIGMGGKPFSTTADTGTLHGSAGTGVIVASLGGIEGLRIQSAIDSHNLGEIEGEKVGTETVHPLANGAATITFTLDQPYMVNFWVDTGSLGVLTAPLSQGRAQPDIALSIGGTGLNGTEYTSNKVGKPDAGESVSLSLPAGTYTLLVRDYTDYTTASRNADEVNSLHLPAVNVGINIKPYKTQRIEGRISIAERDVTMPVNMRMASFDDAGNRIDFDPITKEPLTLNPAKPVWVIFHGMDSSDQSDAIVDVAKALQAYDGMQAVTVNWEEAAKDGIITQDARWTPAVGQWVARQLIAAGFPPALINSAGWSHGSYDAYYMAEEIDRITEGKQQMNALVALDPAGNWPLLSGFDHTVIDFKKFSRNSIAMEGSWIAGSNALAATADISFKINPIDTLPGQVVTTHSLPVTTFAAILEHERTCPGSFSNYISLPNIMNPMKRKTGYQENAYESAFEFTINVGHETKKRIGGDGTYPYANPIDLRYKLPDGKEEIIPINCLA
ncbi:MAG: hypothetical protein WC840_03085, partial [Candidatus Peribacteraceae bacterium]